MASGDLYQLIDTQTLAGQKVLNVYYFRQAAPVLAGNIPQQLCDAFETAYLPDLVPCQAPALVHTELTCDNLFNPSEHQVSTISVPGTWTGPDDDPSFNAAGFRLVQDNGAVKNGAKRIGGLKENTNSGGVFNDAGFIAALIAAGASMILGLDAGIVTNAFLPVIVKRILDAGEYRLPANSGEAVYGNITDALYNANVTSQTSRKIGRGE